MYIIEFGRGPDKKKRKRRGSGLLNKAAKVTGGAALGAVGVLGATRGLRKRNVQLAKDIGDTVKKDLYDESKRKFAAQMGLLSTFKGGRAGVAAKKVGAKRIEEAKRNLQKQYDVVDAFPGKVKRQDRVTYGGIGAGIGGGAALSAVSVGTKEERAAAKRKRAMNNIRSKAGIPEIKRRKKN